jgi:D-beta-D-heptose 7-phosphate kinase/D-beta-D-heptose 1-phosphate adenosyltransferase
MTSLNSKFLDCNRSGKIPKIAIMGDLMIDEYFEVEVNRISPEAPVPVLYSQNEEPTDFKPGGASNVAYQLKNWNVECDLYGIIDSKAKQKFSDFGLNIKGPICDEFPIPRKKRFYQVQSLMRWDIEPLKVQYGASLLNSLLDEFKKSDYDVVILSDYDKGLFELEFTKELIRHCNKNGIITIVDPKNEPIRKWIGCTIFKPNEGEAKKFCGGQSYCVVEELKNKLACKVVVTKGGEGAVGYDESMFEIKCENTVSSNNAIYGYSGAGDCFVATLALAYAHKFNLQEASQIAWQAGASYVKTNHNEPVKPLDLADSKFIHPDDLKDRDFKLVVTNGCFDILHVGHLKTFKEAKKYGDKLAVLINSDESIKELKGESRPINKLEYRKEMLASLECVDFVIDFSEKSPYNLIKNIRPNVLVKGGDYTVDQIRSSELVEETIIVPLVEGLSTTEIIRKAKEE